MNDDSIVSVIDTNIFLTGIDFNLLKGIIYSTAKVIDEIRVKKYKDKNRNILNKIEAALISRKLVLTKPSEEFVSRVNHTSKITGDHEALSYADKELIALTLELIEKSSKNVKLYTNDYSMENVCSELKIPFSSLFKDGIESKIIWEVYCPFCKDIQKSKDLNKKCEICGSKLKRRPKK